MPGTLPVNFWNIRFGFVPGPCPARSRYCGKHPAFGYGSLMAGPSSGDGRTGCMKWLMTGIGAGKSGANPAQNRLRRSACSGLVIAFEKITEFAANALWLYNGGVLVLADMFMSAVKRETRRFPIS